MRAFRDDSYYCKRKSSTIDEFGAERRAFVNISNDFSPCINEVIRYISDFLQICSSEQQQLLSTPGCNLFLFSRGQSRCHYFAQPLRPFSIVERALKKAEEYNVG